MNKARAPLLIALVMVLATSACLVTLPAPASVPATPLPDLAMTGKIQTLTAAPSATFTTSPIPPVNTPTNTLTPFPSITPLPTATSTPTETPFGFVASPTFGTPDLTSEAETPDPAEGATNDWGSDYRCTLVNKSPSDWTVLAPKSLYKVSWTLHNSGKKTWQADGITLTYLDGPKMSEDKTMTLKDDVKTGESIKAVLNIVAPKEPGNYRAVWGMRLNKTDHIFCTFTIKITIQ